MNKENNLFTKDKEFEGLVKKARRASFMKTVLISFVISLIVFFALYFIGTYMMHSKIDKESTHDFLWYSIQGANIEERGKIYNYSPFWATTTTERVKNVGGIPIPWGQREKLYTLFGASKHIQTIGPSSAGKIGDERMLTYFLGQRVIEFYHPKVEYKNIFDDRYVLNNMDDNTVVEFAFSFDRGFSITEVDEVFKEHLEWYWLDTFDNNDINNYSEWNIEEGDFPIDYTILGNEAIGFKYLEEISATMFINVLNRLQEDGGVHQSSVNELVKKLTDNGSLELQPENLQIIGVVVTGTANELKKYYDIPIITGATLGAVTKKYQ